MKFSELKQQFGAFYLYLVLAISIALIGYLAFHLGNRSYAEQQRVIHTHQQSIQNLKAENERLTKNFNILGVELEVAKLAQQKSFVEIEQGIERENSLRTELAFFQQVMAPELNEQGFLIEGFHVEPSLSDRSYRFELVLMQQNKVKNTLKGNLQVLLIGSEGGNAKQYSINGLLVNRDDTLTFGFKYFQVISGELKLPEQFEPEKVSVHAEIFQFKRKKGELTTLFDWSTTDSE